MIVQLRLDERLIHGQVATAWSKYLNVQGIVVVSDKLSKDKLATQTLLMSAPAGKRVACKSVADGINLLADPRGKNMRMLVIVDNPKDAVALVKALPEIEEINCANYVKKKSSNKVQLTQCVNADSEDLEYFKELANIGKHVYSQLIPTGPSVELPEVLAKL